MRNFLVSIALVSMSLVASARSIDMTPVVATVSGHRHGIKEVSLLADGRLQVVSEAGDVHTAQLSQPAFQSLMDSAQFLSSVEVESSTRQVVCMMMAPEALSNLAIGKYNEQKESFEGNETRTVLTAQGCHVYHVVTPTQSWATQTAMELRNALVILALNTLK